MSSGNMASSTSQPGTSSGTSQEFAVRVTKGRQKKLSMLKFAKSLNIDFQKLGETGVKLERENNFKDYKSVYQIDSLPKSGAGSEFGREQKEEARRRRYGIIRKRYNPENQPWQMKIGTGKQAKKFKGVREGTVSENTSFYIFTQCPDGAFEATPVEEWYNFTPVIKYKFLNSEEAEEEFSKRDKVMNYFNVMLKKRIRNDDKDVEGEETEKVPGGKAKKKGKEFKLTDMDDWVEMSDDDGDGDEENEEGEKNTEEEDSKKKGKKKTKKGGEDDGKRKRKNAKNNSDDEAVEESDEGDFDDREVDYMSASESSLSGAEDRDKLDKYEETGVAEERGLRKLIDSEEESEEESEAETQQPTDEKPKEVTNASDSKSSDSSSDSGSDIEKDETTLSSALFMQKKNASEKKKSEKPSSRSGTPNSLEKIEDKLVPKKRKLESEAVSAKRSRTDSPITAAMGASEGITEDAIRRYLMRKPMTTKDLLSKFKSKKINMSTEQMASTIAQLLKRISPERKYVNDVLYLSLKTPD